MLEGLLSKLYQSVRETWIEDLFVESPVFPIVASRLVDFRYRTVTCGGHDLDLYVPAMDRLWIEDDPYRDGLCHEPLATRTFIESLEAGDVVWDMGSMYGYFGSIAGLVTGTPETVHIFEMSSVKTWLIEQQNEELFGGRLTVVPKAVGNADGDDTVSGDGYLEHNDPPDVVKIDIEGAEVAALAGMRETIARHRPSLLIEVHPNKLYYGHGTTDEFIFEILEDHYDTIKACDNYRDRRATWDEDHESYLRGYHDLTGHRIAHSTDLSDPVGILDWDSYHLYATTEPSDADPGDGAPAEDGTDSTGRPDGSAGA